MKKTTEQVIQVLELIKDGKIKEAENFITSLDEQSFFYCFGMLSYVRYILDREVKNER